MWAHAHMRGELSHTQTSRKPSAQGYASNGQCLVGEGELNEGTFEAYYLRLCPVEYVYSLHVTTLI